MENNFVDWKRVGIFIPFVFGIVWGYGMHRSSK